MICLYKEIYLILLLLCCNISQGINGKVYSKSNKS